MMQFDCYEPKDEPQVVHAEADIIQEDYTHRDSDDVLVRCLKDMGSQMATSDGYGYSGFGFGFGGEKFAGGLSQDGGYAGLGVDSGLDYDLLQRRSGALFRTNLYARGLIRRLITNEITTGLMLESTPEERILGVAEDSLEDWSEDIESRFTLWAKTKKLADYTWQATFSKIQRNARMEALICGDVLVVLHTGESGLPSVELVRGERIRTPYNQSAKPQTTNIIDGVELDSRGRQVAYHISQEDGSSKRVTAYGKNSGRRIAWLIYGTEKRNGDVRGEPLLSLVIQSLKEIDRYRDSTQRKALINSLLAIFIKKDEDKPGTRPLSGGAVRKGTSTVTDGTGVERTFKMADALPGMALETLQHGETPVAFGAEGTDVNFGPFEEAIVQGIAWGYEIPPEILKLAFSNNYSASQAAINEFKIYLNRVRTEFGEDFCQPIYEEWLLSMVILGRVDQSEILVSYRSRSDYERYTAWVSADWAGAIKPSTDLKKMAQGYELLIDQGLITRDRSSKETTGTKYSKNVKKLRKENQQLAEAMRPILELKSEFGEEEVDAVTASIEDIVTEAMQADL